MQIQRSWQSFAGSSLLTCTELPGDTFSVGACWICSVLKSQSAPGGWEASLSVWVCALQACYIHCSKRCQSYVEKEPDVFDGERLAVAAATSSKRQRL